MSKLLLLLLLLLIIIIINIIIIVIIIINITINIDTVAAVHAHSIRVYYGLSSAAGICVFLKAFSVGLVKGSPRIH